MLPKLGIDKDTRLSLLFKALMGAAIMTFGTAAILFGSDYGLSLFLPGYKFSGEYVVALVIFFLFTTAFLLLGQTLQWNNWRYFIVGPLAIFLPLIFIATSLRFLFGVENSFTRHYIETYCGTGAPMCGQAFAYVYFSMCLRAIPSVLIIPPLYWFVYSAFFFTKTNSAL